MYKLEVTEEQAKIIQNALDLYSRVLIGQVSEGIKTLAWETKEWKDHNGETVPPLNLHEFADFVENAKPVYLGLHPNASHGIHSENVSDKARKSYDIQQVIRHKLAWDREGKDPNKDSRDYRTMMGVNYDEPTVSSNDENFKLPTIEKV